MENNAQPAGLRGARGWLITDAKVGMLVQCRGVADALGLSYVHKQVSPQGIHRLLSPWIMPQRSERLGKAGSLFSPPWPDVAIATGRLSIPYIRCLSRLAGDDIYTVVLQDPRTGLGTADLIWVPEHDSLRGRNVITTLTAPHSYSQARLSEIRKSMAPQIAALPAPRASVLLGGDGGGYRFTRDDGQKLAAALASLAAFNISFMITPSRRTSAHLLQVVEKATRSRPRVLWSGTGENPYAEFLAHADVLIATADSVNMTGEAAATGRPVYVFAPSYGSAKFARFHEAMRRYGATRALPHQFTTLQTWCYEPLDAARPIAAEIEQRWLAARGGEYALVDRGR
jgi:mitochondrial fission protein ELM1